MLWRELSPVKADIKRRMLEEIYRPLAQSSVGGFDLAIKYLKLPQGVPEETLLDLIEVLRRSCPQRKRARLEQLASSPSVVLAREVRSARNSLLTQCPGRQEKRLILHLDTLDLQLEAFAIPSQLRRQGDTDSADLVERWAASTDLIEQLTEA